MKRSGADRVDEGELAAAKEFRRRAVQQWRAELAPVWVAEASAIIQRRALELLAMGGQRHVGCYLAMPCEVQTAALVAGCRERGLALYLPAWISRREGYRLTLAEGPMRAGPLGILQPETVRPVAASVLDIIFVPGVAFDRQGHRLGHGGGHYDRLLAGAGDRPLRVGLAFDFQLLEAVPSGPRDVNMNMVITNEDLRRPGGAPEG